MESWKSKRSVEADGKINVDITTVEAADARKYIACVTIYGRYLKKDGTNSCQLLFSWYRVTSYNPQSSTMKKALSSLIAGLYSTGYQIKTNL